MCITLLCQNIQQKTFSVEYPNPIAEYVLTDTVFDRDFNEISRIRIKDATNDAEYQCYTESDFAKRLSK